MLGPWIKANWKWSNRWKTVNFNILGISKLNWTGMGEFNSDDHYFYYCWQESLRWNGVAIIVNERVQNAALGCTLRNNGMISVHFQGKALSITVIQVYALTSNAEEAEVEWFYEDLQDLLELIYKKYVKTRISRNTCSSSQICPWSTEWSREKTNRVLPRECTGHSKHHLPTTQDSTHACHQMEEHRAP